MEKKLNSLIISFFVLFTLSSVMIALFSVFGVLYTDSTEFAKESNIEYELEALADDVEPTLNQTDDFGQEYINKIIFLGESTTYGLQRYGVLAGGKDTDQIWTGASLSNGVTVSSGTLSLSPAIDNTKIFYPDDKSAKTVREAILTKNPDILIITLGLNNGASYYSEEKFKLCYRILLDSILGCDCDTKIILQSLFPVSRGCNISAYTPSRLRECNKWIYDLAKEYNLKYLNTWETLSDCDGYLLNEYDNGGDGIHLNAKGLEAVLSYIRTHGYRE